MEFSITYYVIIYSSLLSSLLPVLTGVLNDRHLDNRTRPFLFFFYYVVLSEACSYLMAQFGIKSSWWRNIYSFNEVLFFAWFFNQWIFGNKGKKAFALLCLFFVPFWVYTTFFVFGISEANSFAFTVNSLVIATYAGIILIRLSQQANINLFKNFQFWIASGAMIYFSFGVLVFSIYQVVANNDYVLTLFSPLWNVHSFMNIISNLLYSIAFLCPGMISKFHNRK
jgi:hypothetical protein